MKKISLIAFLLISSLGITFAQDGESAKTNRTPEERAEIQTKRLTKALTLTEEQQSQVKSIALTQAQEMDGLIAKHKESGEKGAFREEAETLTSQTDAALKGVFTPEQYEQYVTLKEKQTDKQREKMQQRRAGRKKN